MSSEKGGPDKEGAKIISLADRRKRKTEPMSSGGAQSMPEPALASLAQNSSDYVQREPLLEKAKSDFTTLAEDIQKMLDDTSPPEALLVRDILVLKNYYRYISDHSDSIPDAMLTKLHELEQKCRVKFPNSF